MVPFNGTIRKADGYDANSYTYYPVAIIGAGASGIAMACRLKEVLGFDQFRVFERQGGIGGTWWINRYPGVAVDIPAVFYSFSFAQNPDWTQFHPNGPEIVSYLQDVTEKYKVLDKIQLDTEVMECRWNEEQHVWHIKLQHYQPEMGDLSKSDRDRKVEQEGHAAVYGKEEHIKAKVLVSCAGGLVEPKSWPDNIPGRDKFQGQIFHSARWRYDVDLKDKEVVVVGTGCSAAQFVPKLTSEYGAKKVTQIMRSPPWVIPRPEPPGGEEHFNKVAPWRNRYIPGHQQLMRWMNASLSEWDWRLFGNSEWNKKQRATLEKQLIAHMQTTVPQKYWEMLTPNYAVCGKRRIFDATWFPGLRDPRIELTTLPLQTLNEDSVTLGPKRTYPDPANTASQVPNEPVTIPADVIILANGFDVVKWLDPITVIGRGGKNLHAVQQERGGPQMYLGTAMDSFPNFFAIFGPNTATGHTSVILAAENGINLVLKLVKGVLEGEVEEVEVKEEAERRWARMMQEGNRKTVFHQDGVRSWYRTEGGWNSTTYPYSQIWFTLACMFPRWRDWTFKYTPQGLARRRRRLALRTVTYALAIYAALRARKAGYQLKDVPSLVRQYARQGLLLAAEQIQRMAGRV